MRAALLACCAAVVLALPSAARADQLRGAQVHATWSDWGQSVISQEFDALQQAGANSVRIDVPWPAFASGPGQYDDAELTYLDWVFRQAHAHGLGVVATFVSVPCWASSAPAGLTNPCTHQAQDYPPQHAQDYADAAAFVVRRWGFALAAMEIWNEPNGGYLTSPTPAADYARLLNAAYPAIKAAAPALPVLMTMSGTDVSFLAQMYAQGARGSYDGIAVHPYDDASFGALQAFRAYAASRGDTSPLWVTELGWPSNEVGEQAQAANTSSAVSQLAALPYVAAVEVYNLRDKGTNPNDPEDHYGLLNRDLTPKAAWNAFAAVLSGRQPSPSPPSNPPSGPANGAAGPGRPNPGDESPPSSALAPARAPSHAPRARAGSRKVMCARRGRASARRPRNRTCAPARTRRTTHSASRTGRCVGPEGARARRARGRKCSPRRRRARRTLSQ